MVDRIILGQHLLEWGVEIIFFFGLGFRLNFGFNLSLSLSLYFSLYLSLNLGLSLSFSSINGLDVNSKKSKS